MVNIISNNTPTIALASVVSAPSPLINYADRILLNELNRLEEQKQSMTFLKNSAMQNKTQLEQKAGHDDQASAEIDGAINEISLKILSIRNMLQKPTHPPQLSNFTPLPAIVRSNSHNNNNNADPIDLINLSNTADRLQNGLGQTTNASNHQKINRNSNSLSRTDETLDASTDTHLNEGTRALTIEKPVSMQKYLRQVLSEEDPLDRITDLRLGELLTDAGHPCSGNSAGRYRKILNIPSVTERYKSNSNANNHAEQQEEALNNTAPITQRKSTKRKENPHLNDNSIDLTIDEGNSNSSNASPTNQTQNVKFLPPELTPLQKRLKEIITTSGPKTARELSETLLKEKLINCTMDQAMRIVKRNRHKLDLPNSTGKQILSTTKAARARLQQIMDNEDHDKPFTDTELVVELKKYDIILGRKRVHTERAILGYPSREERYQFYKNLNSNSNNSNSSSSHSNSSKRNAPAMDLSKD